MIPATHSLIALQDKAMLLTARLVVVRMIAPKAPAAAIRARGAVMPVPCRKQNLEKIRTSFSRQWTELVFRRAAMVLEIGPAMAVLVAVTAVVAMAQMVEVAVAVVLAAHRAPGSHHPVAMFRGSKHPDDGLTRVTEMIELPISRTR